MNEQSKAIIDRARALLAAATPGPWHACGESRGWCDCGNVWSIPTDAPVASATAVWEGGELAHAAVKANAALIAAAPSLLAAICDALESAERRAEEAEVRDAHNRAEVERVIGPTLVAMKRAGVDSLPDATEEPIRRLDAAEAERDAFRERAGIADGREGAAKANAEQMAGWMEARTATACECGMRGASGAVIMDGVTVAHALTVAEVQRESYDTARAKGWHDEDETPPAPIRVIAWMGLICSEAAEAIEDARNGHMSTTIREDGKPDGLGSELADIVIRVCDSAGALGIDMEAELRAKLAFNRTRSHKHGGKLA